MNAIVTLAPCAVPAAAGLGRRAARGRLSVELLPILTFLVCVALLVLRRPTVLIAAQPWAEDGSVFLQGAVSQPWALWAPYAGYLHVLPRLTANLALLMGLPIAPLVMNGIALLLEAAAAAAIAATRFQFLVPQRWVRVWLAVFVTAIPNVPEIVGNITNVQWYLDWGLLLFAAAWLFCPDEQERDPLWAKAALAVLYVLSLLSTPLALVIGPLVAAAAVTQLVRGRNPAAPAWLLAFSALGCAAQGAALLSSSHDGYAALAHPVSSVLGFWGSEVTGRLLYILLLPLQRATGSTLVSASFLFALIGVAGVVQALRRRQAIDAYLAFLCVVFVVMLSIARPDYVSSFPAHAFTPYGGRFAALPTFVLCLLFTREAARHGRWLQAGLLVTVTASALPFFTVPALPDVGFAAAAAAYHPSGDRTCRVPLNPAGGAWWMVVPCA